MTFQRGDLSRPVLIHLCKDRTLSYRRAGSRIFNGAALPVFSVENEAEAQDLLVLVGTRVPIRHPHPKYPHETWYKLFNGLGGDKPTLDLEDTEAASDYLREAYAKLRKVAA